MPLKGGTKRKSRARSKTGKQSKNKGEEEKKE